MEQTESRTALLGMQYLGTFRAKGGPPARDKLTGIKRIFTLLERRGRKRRIRTHGPKAAKPDFSLPAPGSGVGDCPDQTERAETGAKDLGGDAGS